MDADLRSAGMSNDVRERLLEDPEKRGAEILVEQRFSDIGVHITFDSRAGLKIIGLPFQGSCQAQVVQDRWAQFAGNAADGLNRGIDVSREGPSLIDERPEVARQSARNPGQIQFATCQCLAEFIMHLARNPSSLLFPDCLKID
jgi:hypothetical protein